MTFAERGGVGRYRPRAYHRKLGALVVAAALFSGCGLVPGGERPVTTTRPEAPADPLVLEMLADGEVTAAELDEAFHAYVGCMEAAGMVGRYAYDAERLGHTWTMEYNMPGDGPQGRLTDVVEGQCFGGFLSPLEGRFDDPVPQGERMDQRRRDTIDCMAEVDPTFTTIPADVSVEPGSDMQLRALQANNDAIAECIDTGGLGWTEFTSHEAGDD